jgi:transposase
MPEGWVQVGCRQAGSGSEGSAPLVWWHSNGDTIQHEPAIKQFRSLATRYDKTARNYAAQVVLACIVVWLRL